MSSYKDTSRMKLGRTAMTWPDINDRSKDPLSKYS